ncbi:Rieske (2Fe-2S) protein [Pseudonocardia sp. H11422]|uniref:Rieske (2Fe-2S) protein n=1 Tax=Pseudonocardia sp. H11422 TaxID=2835866 RepID=UPI001BDD71F7|nr:Rieske (2Fe-2S) protein [Pseudonocardia sp. H11422]
MSLVPLDAPAGTTAGARSWVVSAPDGRRFAVFRTDDGGYRVTDAVCPHNRGPMEQGWLREGGLVVCPWHWYRFDVETGECDTTPQYRLGVYPVLERDGRWLADVGEPAAPRSWAERLRAHARGES